MINGTDSLQGHVTRRIKTRATKLENKQQDFVSFLTQDIESHWLDL